MKCFWLLSVVGLLLSPVANASDCLHYDLPAVQISGRIARVVVTSVGASLGDDLQPEYAWYLSTTKPLCILPGPKKLGNLAVTGIRRFEILPSPNQPDLTRYLGQEVRLKGSFVPTYIPHYHTNLTFSVESVSLLRGP